MRTFLVALAVAVFCVAGLAQSQPFTTIPLAKSAEVTQIAVGPDDFLYVAADKTVYKIDPAALSQPVWTTTLAYGRSTQPTGLCFHKDLGVVLMVGPDYIGTVTDPDLWAIVPFDGSGVNYHLIPVGFGGGGCAVDDQGNIYLSSMVQGSTALGGAAIAMITPPQLDKPIPVSGLNGALVPYLLSTPDGKTVIAVTKSNGKSVVALIQKGQIVSTVMLPFAAVRPPRLSPDDGTVYISGNNCTSTCPTPTVSGVAAYNISQGTVSILSNNLATDLAWSATDGYYLFNTAVSPFDIKTWTFDGLNVQFKNPDASSGNQQFLVFRKQFADTLVVLQSDRLLIWDVPRLTIAKAVVDSATCVHLPSPGNWGTVFGRALDFSSWAVGAPVGGKYPTVLDTARTQLQYSGKTVYAEMFFASSGQVNFLVPADVPIGTGTLKVTPQTVNEDGTWTSGNTLTVDVAEFSPGIFAITDSQSGRVISDASAAAPGSTIVLWAGGLGPTQPGQYSLDWTVTMPTVMIGGIPAPVIFSGLAPGFVGLYQVNVTVPPSTANGIVDLTIMANGQQAAARVLIGSGQ